MARKTKEKQLELPLERPKKRESAEAIPESDRQWYSTRRAAAYLDISVGALLMAVSRGRIQPDRRGNRGRSRQHSFSRQTLDAYHRDSKAA